LTCEEALFGGATGGGKTEALLMWLAEGFNIPDYSGVIFRRYEADLTEGNSSVLAKSMRLYPHLGGKLAGLEWRFPSGATIELQGIAHDRSVLSVQGKAFHRVAFDELTHFTAAQYEFVVRNRIRKLKNFPIFCGVRCSANPGGPGHDHTVEKFITEESIKVVRDLDLHEPTPMGMIFWKNPDTAYVPSRAADNPSLDVQDYFNRQLKNKNPVERARMMNGDWGISPEGLIKPNWLRYYILRGASDSPIIDLLVSKPDSKGMMQVTDEVLKSIHVQLTTRFMTMDTAGGMKDLTQASKGKSPSWSVAMVWDYYRKNNVQALILRHTWRDRVGFTEVADQLRLMNEQWKPSSIKVENATMGPHLVSLLAGTIPISTIPIKVVGYRDNDKVTRATPLLNMLEKGEVYLPRYENTWCKVLETEWLGWQGLEEETNDQVDTAAYAAIFLGGLSGNEVRVDFDPRKSNQNHIQNKRSGWW
jgi:phage terminase large subunit-like protein